MIDLGIVKPGSTVYIPFGSYDGGTGAPSAMTGLALGDIKVYKDGSVTERASTSGFSLLDTDGLDFDGLVGINGISIDLADNTTAGFWAAGSRYWVVLADVTVDAQTVRFIAATFTIGHPAAILNTTIATLATQTSFTLTKGPAEDDALNGCVVYFHDVASEVQGGFAVVLDYVGVTKTVTLAAATTFTIAASDNVMVMPPAPDSAGVATLLSRLTAARAGYIDNINNANLASVPSGVSTLTSAGVRSAVGLASANLDTQLDGLPTAAEVADAVWDEAIAGHLAGGTTGSALNSAGSAGDPWATLLPGSYGAGTAGYIVGNRLDAAMSSRLAAGSYAAPLDAAGVRAALGMVTSDLPMEAADALLGRNVAGGSSTGRLVKEALYFLRNKWSISAGTLTVYGTDDATPSWTSAMTKTAGDPVSASDPA